MTQGAKKIADGQHKIEEGMNTFGVKLNEATAGTKKIADGASNLADGFTKWGNGFTSLQEGVNQLASGGTELNNGAGKLTNGLVKLDDGAKELSTKLGEGAEKIADVRNDDARNTMFSEPVQLVKSTVSDVPNYGSGIAPYFLSLAFYVGGIMASNILPLGRRQNMKVSGTVHFINKLGLVYLIGLIQALLVDVVVLGVMKLEVASVPLFCFIKYCYFLYVHDIYSYVSNSIWSCWKVLSGNPSCPAISDERRYFPRRIKYSCS